MIQILITMCLAYFCLASEGSCDYIEKSYSLCENDIKCRHAYGLDGGDYDHFSYLVKTQVVGHACHQTDLLVYHLMHASLCNNTALQHTWLHSMKLATGTSSSSSRSSSGSFQHWYVWVGIILALVAILYTSYGSAVECKRTIMIYDKLCEISSSSSSPAW